MIDLVFPDGSSRQYPDGSTGRDVAAAISKSLEKKALLIKLDGQVLDLDRPLTPDLLTGERKFEILTREAPEALDTIRHDTAHVLAEAVQELFPGTQVTIGPNVEDADRPSIPTSGTGGMRLTLRLYGADEQLQRDPGALAAPSIRRLGDCP